MHPTGRTYSPRRWRRLVGLLERAMLGTAMTLVLMVAERRVRQARRPHGAAPLRAARAVRRAVIGGRHHKI